MGKVRYYHSSPIVQAAINNNFSILKRVCFMIEFVIGILATVLIIGLWCRFKMTHIKVLGQCVSCMQLTRGWIGNFMYSIDGVRYNEYEERSHLGHLIGGCEYIIYVNKKNYNKFICAKAVRIFMFIVVLNYIALIAMIVVEELLKLRISGII